MQDIRYTFEVEVTSSNLKLLSMLPWSVAFGQKIVKKYKPFVLDKLDALQVTETPVPLHE